ncbi:MAG: cytochrome c oxidase assembly protein [Betaproteobacteria bacterium]|nr:cytochrome c oxidase assembly protein [Betaproteobacteria bacterium]
MNVQPRTANIAAGNRRLAWQLAAGALLMTGFGYLLVPLYQVFCEYTGFNGTTSRINHGQAATQGIDRTRWVTVEFAANTSVDLPWEFSPVVASVRVHPGEMVLAQYQARNLGNRAIVGQAVPSVTPGTAAAHFRKIECFCFSRQPLDPGQALTLPVQFQVDTDLPREIGTLTLSYTFFEQRGGRISSARPRLTKL